MIRKKYSYFASFSSWKLSLIAFFLSLLFIVLLALLLNLLRFSNEYANEVIFFIFYNLFIAIACFLICLKDPSSAWYVPIICNILSITVAIFLPAFWTSELWIGVLSGWILSLVGAIIGSVIGVNRAQS
jgi:hypothetical protein